MLVLLLLLLLLLDGFEGSTGKTCKNEDNAIKQNKTLQQIITNTGNYNTQIQFETNLNDKHVITTTKNQLDTFILLSTYRQTK